MGMGWQDSEIASGHGVAEIASGHAWGGRIVR